VLTRALASLRRKSTVYVASADCEVAFGALRLLSKGLRPPVGLMPVAALPEDLEQYRRRWHQEVARNAK
jgi:hypothetical protein